jgi:hypothetical protein
MKTTFKYIGLTALALLVLVCLSYTMEWAFWKLAAIAVIGTGVYLLYSKVGASTTGTIGTRAGHPKLAKAIAMVILITLAGSWTWSWLNGSFPFLSGTRSYAEKSREVRLARVIDPGFSGAQEALLLELRKKEDALAAEIPALMQTNNFAQVKTNAEGLVKLRQEVEKLLAQMPPSAPPPAPKPGSTPSALPTVSTFTVNKDEVISTLSVPDNSTIYIEADKAFCILERYGNYGDGSEKLSKLTIQPGKTEKHFPWGGTVRVAGLYTNTTIKVHL